MAESRRPVNEIQDKNKMQRNIHVCASFLGLDAIGANAIGHLGSITLGFLAPARIAGPVYLAPLERERTVLC
jgi:hypothetical protein